MTIFDSLIFPNGLLTDTLRWQRGVFLLMLTELKSNDAQTPKQLLRVGKMLKISLVLSLWM